MIFSRQASKKIPVCSCSDRISFITSSRFGKEQENDFFRTGFKKIPACSRECGISFMTSSGFGKEEQENDFFQTGFKKNTSLFLFRQNIIYNIFKIREGK